ncbi:MAG: CvpA family protein [Clostridia bacterium]|nr:CvpA family protein [Clostridia bacterium]
MFNWIDIVIVIIVLYNVIRGFSLGFIRSVVGIIGYVVAFFVSKEYHEFVLTYALNHFQVISDMQSTIAYKIETMLINSISEGTASLAQPTLTGSGISFLEHLNVQDFIAVDTVATNSASEIGVKIAAFIMNGLSAIVVFMAVLLVIKIIGVILNALMELPVLKSVNRFAGLLIGIVKGGLFVFSIMTLLAFLSPTIHDTAVMQALYQSKVGIVFYNNNILLALINMFLLG